ncbi:MAG: di-heme oxidoredictase family protein [Planctomycetota bacterium]
MRPAPHLLAAALLLATATSAQHPASASVERLGGVATVDDTGGNAFGFPARVLDRKQRRRFLVGNSFFKQNWVEAPASASQRDGLGPLFNARSCSSCHLKDGRSAPPRADEHDRHGLLIRIGVRRAHGPDAPHPHYGGQVQDASVQGVAAEARVAIRYREVHGHYQDGQPFTLLQPEYELQDLRYGELGDDATIGPRVAPQLVGLGLLEAVPVAVLARRADPNDTNRDGISGRVPYLDAARTIVGRFGWKASEPTVRSQTAAAFVNDIGITSAVQPREAVTTTQRATVTVDEAEPEIRTATFDKVVFYTQALAVPAQRDADDPQVQRGHALFEAYGCASCHAPTLETGDDAFVEAYRNQRFHPFTDLLLHDMGAGLADQKRDGDAQPSEWRTPPLWGIGLVETVNGHTRLLHDGRARDLAEAILWHGGEASGAREFFRRAPAGDRAALLAFVRSL